MKLAPKPKDDPPTFEQALSVKKPRTQNPKPIHIRRTMTDTTTQKLITQLRALQQLTNTEAQIAQTRQVQARDEAVRNELATNAANAQERGQLIAAALRDLGGVPDVVTPALGRATALAKTVSSRANRSPPRCSVTSLWNTNCSTALAIWRPSPTPPATSISKTWRGAYRLHTKKPSSGSPRCSSKKRRGSPRRCGPPRCRRRWVGSPASSITRPGGPLNGLTGPLRPWPAPAHGSAPSPKPRSIR